MLSKDRRQRLRELARLKALALEPLLLTSEILVAEPPTEPIVRDNNRGGDGWNDDPPDSVGGVWDASGGV